MANSKDFAGLVGSSRSTWKPAPAAAARLRRELSRTTKIVAAVLQPNAIREILGHLGLPTTPPKIATARAPPQGEWDF